MFKYLLIILALTCNFLAFSMQPSQDRVKARMMKALENTRDTFISEPSQQHKCPLCLEDNNKEKLDCCENKFHPVCLNKWKQAGGTECPVCIKK